MIKISENKMLRQSFIVLCLIVVSAYFGHANCSDGIQNGDEEDIDCGGSCSIDCNHIYYVSQTGSGTECSQLSPCNFSYAQQNAVKGSRVYLYSGDYGDVTFDSNSATGNSTDWITYKALNFQQANFSSLVFTIGEVDAYLKFQGLRIDPGYTPTNKEAVTLDDVDYLTFDSCYFEGAKVDDSNINLGELGPYCYKNDAIIRSLQGEDTDYITIVNNTFIYGHNSISPLGLSDNWIIENNTITEFCDNGIQFGAGSGNSIIRGNHIYNSTSRKGWFCWEGSQIGNWSGVNVGDRFNQSSGATGRLFYIGLANTSIGTCGTSGVDTVILLYPDNVSTVPLTNTQYDWTLMSNSSIYFQPSANGDDMHSDMISIEGTSSNIVVERNILHDGTGHTQGIKIGRSGGISNNITIRNNLVYDLDATVPIIYIEAGNGNYFINNVFDTGDYPASVRFTNADIQSVYFYNNILSGYLYSAGTISESDYNIIGVDGIVPAQVGEGSNSQAEIDFNTLFINWGTNYSTATGSVAINNGTSFSDFSEDILGNPRPSGSGWDIGAYEYQEPSLIIPLILTTYPTNTTYSSNVTMINYTVTDGESCWYSTDSGVINSSAVPAGTNWTGLDLGSSTMTVYCNSSDSTITSDEVVFSVSISCLVALTNTSWSGWIDISTCQVNDTIQQVRNLTQYDANNCGDYSNQTFFDTQDISCNYCSFHVQNTTWSDWANISCLPDDTMNQSRSRTEYDANYDSCYAVTSQESDLWNGGSNITHYEYQLNGACVFSDNQPPITTTYLNGKSTYNDQWHNNNISITFTCSDNVACDATYYCIDQNNICNPWAGSRYLAAFNHTLDGIYYLRYASNDSWSNVEQNHSIILKKAEAPPSPKWNRYQNNDTTDFDSIPLINATHISVGVPNIAKVTFNNPIDLVQYNGTDFIELDFDTYINISSKKISINSSALPMLNTSANLTFYDIMYENPQIEKDGNVFTNYTILQSPNISNNHTFTINVSSFSTYEVVEGPYCGDNVCNNGETSSTCSADCSSGGSSGGGGSGSSAPALPPTYLTVSDNWAEYNFYRTGVIYFNISDDLHRAVFSKANTSSLTFSMLSSSEVYSLNVNQPLQVDINGSSIDLIYTGIKGSEISLKIRSHLDASQPVPPQQTNNINDTLPTAPSPEEDLKRIQPDIEEPASSTNKSTSSVIFSFTAILITAGILGTGIIYYNLHKISAHKRININSLSKKHSIPAKYIENIHQWLIQCHVKDRLEEGVKLLKEKGWKEELIEEIKKLF